MTKQPFFFVADRVKHLFRVFWIPKDFVSYKACGQKKKGCKYSGKLQPAGSGLEAHGENY
jgi:hypothetical protein